MIDAGWRRVDARCRRLIGEFSCRLKGARCETSGGSGLRHGNAVESVLSAVAGYQHGIGHIRFFRRIIPCSIHMSFIQAFSNASQIFC